MDGSGEGVAERIMEACGVAKAVIDLVNGTSTAVFAFAEPRKGGKLIQVGLFGGELPPLPVMAMRELTIQGKLRGQSERTAGAGGVGAGGKLQPVPITQVPQSSANEG